jgi:hypothetical protein
MLLKSCFPSEPLHDHYPGDYQERSDNAREAGLVHRDPDQAEVVDHYRGENLLGEDELDGGRGAEAWGEDYRSEDEERAEQTPSTPTTARYRPNPVPAGTSALPAPRRRARLSRP